MIIKSMARKSPSFRQLAKYMDKGKKNHKSFEVFYNNLYSRENEGISEEFKNNADNLKYRKNGNYLYHEVISITRSPEMDFEKQKEILYSLVNDYVSLRAKRNLVYGIMHTDKKNDLHYHLMISSNELGSEKRHRLNKSTFANIQKSIEKNVLNNFPELGQKIIYNQNKAEKTKKGEYELKKRTGKESQRDIVKRELTEIFKTSKGKADFFNKLSASGYEVYIKGNTIGVKWEKTGRNYRLKTLGLLDKFNSISGKIEEVEHRKEEIKESREEQNKEKEIKSSKEEYKQESKFKNEEVKPKKEKISESEKKSEENQEETKQSEKQKEINEVRLEIERRKQELKKQREEGQEYGKDYDKGDKSL